jgi:hypothetical protein
MKNQINYTLPRSEWQKVVIKENNEPMVEIKETSRLKVGLVNKGYQPSFCVRRTVAKSFIKILKLYQPY